MYYSVLVGLNLGVQILRESKIKQYLSPLIQISIYLDLPKIDEGDWEMTFETCPEWYWNIQTFDKVEWPHQRPDYNKTIQIIKTIQNTETTIF